MSARAHYLMDKHLFPDQLHSGYITNTKDSHFLISSPTMFQNGQHLFKILFHRASMKLFHQWLLDRKYHSKIVPVKQSSAYEKMSFTALKPRVIDSKSDVLPLAKNWVLNNYQGCGDLSYYNAPFSNKQVPLWLDWVTTQFENGVQVPNVQAVYWLLLHHDIISRTELENMIQNVSSRYHFLLEIEETEYDTSIQNPYHHTKKYADRGLIPSILRDFEQYGSTNQWQKLATYFAITQTHPDEMYMFIKSHCMDFSPDRARHKVNYLISLQKTPVFTGDLEWDALAWTFVHKTKCNMKLYQQLQDMNDIIRSRYFLTADRILK